MFLTLVFLDRRDTEDIYQRFRAGIFHIMEGMGWDVKNLSGADVAGFFVGPDEGLPFAGEEDECFFVSVGAVLANRLSGFEKNASGTHTARFGRAL